MEFNATFLVSIISFLVFVEIMNRIFYVPLTSVVAKRKEMLDANYNDAKKFDDDAQVILKDRDDKLTKADTDSRKIISERVESENSKGKLLTDEAAKKSAEDIQSKKASLAEEKISVSSELDSRVVGLAENIASKVMGMEVKIDDEALLNGVK